MSTIERLAGGISPVTLAVYSYDDQGRLKSVCDPRPTQQLCSNYTYTTVNGRTLLATATPPGQKAWRFAYDSTGRLITVKRALDETTNTGSGDATWTAVYDLPINTAGLPAMSSSAVTEWGQDAAPDKVFAVFTPVKVPAGSTPSATELPYASLWYTDDQGTTTNTAAFGAGTWLVATNWYDQHGNIVRQLDGAGRARALAAPSGDRANVAYDASSLTFYNSDPANGALDARRVEDFFGPVHTATLRDGTTGPFRAHTSYTYDDEDASLGGGSKPAVPEGRPGFDLVVETRHSAAGADLVGDFDTVVVRKNYNPLVAGDGNGWALRTPTQVMTKLTDGSWSTQVTRYDTDGRLIETRQPGGATNSDGSGADAHATVTSYYAPGAADSDCNTTNLGKPAWAGLLCKTGPAVQPTGNPMPTTYQAAYGGELQPTRVEERSGSTTRVTTTGYDALGRQTSQTISIGTQSRSTSTGYDPVTGLAATTSSGADTVTTTYDTWGRVKTYTDATGATAATTYTADGLVATKSDGVGTYTYTYDSDTEHRRMPTSISVGGVTGAFALAYNAAGAPTTVTYPNGLKRSYSYDEAGTPTGLQYSAADGTGLLAFNNTTDVDGRVVAATSPASQEDYTYDDLGRLTKVEDNRSNGCTTHTYGFAPSSERTSFNAYAPSADGSCQTDTAAITRTSTYDPANRIQNAGYTYDDLGRTLTVPAGDTAAGGIGSLTATYQVNDMIKTLTQNVDDGNGGTIARGTSYALDPTGRINIVTNTTAGTETNRLRYRFSDASDSPTSIQTSTDAGTTWNTTRYVLIPGLGMVASVADGTATWQLANLQGDVVATQTTSSGIDEYAEYDEYGNPIDTNLGRYGWLGNYQRSTDAVGGIDLMGARVYNPAMGAFLTPDAVPGGNATAYCYPADPINEMDPSGYKLIGYDVGEPMTFKQAWELRRELLSGSSVAHIAKAMSLFMPDGVGAIWNMLMDLTAGKEERIAGEIYNAIYAHGSTGVVLVTYEYRSFLVYYWKVHALPYYGKVY